MKVVIFQFAMLNHHDGTILFHLSMDLPGDAAHDVAKKEKADIEAALTEASKKRWRVAAMEIPW